MNKIPAISFFFLFFVLFGCKEKPTENEKNSTGTPVTTDNSPSAATPKEKISGILIAYYSDLSAKTLDESRYFAPTLKKFFKAENISREDAAKSIRNGFKSVENRSINLNGQSLQVIPAGEGFIAEFSGTSSYTPSGKTERVDQPFSNRVTFDKDFLITSYEAIDNTAALNREAGDSNTQMAAARAILEAVKTGKPEKALPYIHPDMGFWLLTQPGAVSVPYACGSLNDVYNYAPWLKKGIENLDLQPAQEKLPDFDCGDLFSKQGCFMDKTSGYQGISGLMGSLRELQLGNYTDEQISDAASLEKYVSVAIVDTDANIGFMLGQIDGKWYLLIMDMASYDCSA
ncbi:MAG: hypothetical protein R3C61_28150 [Bacteroidia bacterium]